MKRIDMPKVQRGIEVQAELEIEEAKGPEAFLLGEATNSNVVPLARGGGFSRGVLT